MFTSVARFGAFFVLMCGVALVPEAASAQSLNAGPTSFTVQSSAGQDAPSQTMTIRNSGGKALKWTVGAITTSSGGDWLIVSPTRGTQAGTLVLTFRTSGLPQGSYQASFGVDSNGGSAPVTVQLNVGAAPAGALPSPAPTLTVSCPASQSIASLDGKSVVVNYSATASGGVAPVTVTGNPASGSAFPVGATSVTVTAQSSDGQTANCGFTVTVTYTQTSVSPDGAMVPTTASQIVDNTGAVWTIASNSAILRNGTSAAGGYGSKIYWKSSTIYVYGTDSNWWQWTGSGWTNIGPTQPGTTPSSPPPPTSTSAVGPQSTITCPAGAIGLSPGDPIPQLAASYPGNTTFCLRAGVHYLYSAIVPKTGDVFVGEYGAILDGSGWSTTDRTQGAFRGQNIDVDYVTIRNLVIRNMPQRGIHFYAYMSDHWTVEYNEIANNKDVGIHFGSYSLIRNNYIHHNTFAGYYGDPADYTTIENNEIAYNGHDEKVGESANVTFRNNYVHNNVGMGIWFDWDNTGGLVEGNLVEDNGASGIQFEVSSDGIVRNNIVRRSGQNGIYISTSKNMQVYGNTLENNYRGIQYFINCAAIGQGKIGFDLVNVSAYDNTVTVGTQSGAWANFLNYSGDCTSTQLAPYLNGSKNLTFTHNTYRVPSLANWYWLWGSQPKFWNQWQAIPQDATGTVTQP